MDFFLIKKSEAVLRTSESVYFNDEVNYSIPNRTPKPLSTPENPMNAIASRPAVTNAIAIPCIPLGIFTKLNCSRIPANNTIAKAKPRAVEGVNHASQQIKIFLNDQDSYTQNTAVSGYQRKEYS